MDSIILYFSQDASAANGRAQDFLKSVREIASRSKWKNLKRQAFYGSGNNAKLRSELNGVTHNFSY